MRISTVANWLAAVCALVASVVCYQLVLRHVTGLSGPAWFELGCSDKPGGAAAGCTEVLASPYSYFPPKHGKNVPAGLPHIPVAFMGLMYYSTLLAWLVGVGRPAYAKRGLHYAAFLLVALGLVGSAVLRVDHVPRDFGVVPMVHVYAFAQFADFHLHGFHVAKAEGGGWRKNRGGGQCSR